MPQKSRHGKSATHGAGPQRSHSVVGSEESRAAAPAPTSDSAVEQKLIALAEQMVRLIGTVQAKTEGWLDRRNLEESLTRIREGASDVLAHLTPRTGETQTGDQRSEPRASNAADAGGLEDPAHAPGKKHRQPAPSARGVKHSDQRVAKMRNAEEVRRRRKSKG